jgi:hypothetical protein
LNTSIRNTRRGALENAQNDEEKHQTPGEGAGEVKK